MIHPLYFTCYLHPMYMIHPMYFTCYLYPMYMIHPMYFTCYLLRGEAPSEVLRAGPALRLVHPCLSDRLIGSCSGMGGRLYTNPR